MAFPALPTLGGYPGRPRAQPRQWESGLLSRIRQAGGETRLRGGPLLCGAAGPVPVDGHAGRRAPRSTGKWDMIGLRCPAGAGRVRRGRRTRAAGLPGAAAPTSDYPDGAVVPVMPVTVQARGGWLAPLRRRASHGALITGRGGTVRRRSAPGHRTARARPRARSWGLGPALARRRPARSAATHGRAEGTCPGQHSGECGAPVRTCPVALSGAALRRGPGPRRCRSRPAPSRRRGGAVRGRACRRSGHRTRPGGGRWRWRRRWG